MIDGLHAILFSRDADALRAFFRDVLELPSVDAGGGWDIFGLPPAEVAAHPADDARRASALPDDERHRGDRRGAATRRASSSRAP